ncbi:30S ribosomal protein S3, partial [Mycobacterium sp. ITM-2017-0098]
KRELSAAAPAADRPRRERPTGATRPRRSGASGTTATSTDAGRAATEEAPAIAEATVGTEAAAGAPETTES